MLIEVTLYLTHGNRKVIALFDCGADKDLISQHFIKKNGLEVIPVGRMGIIINKHYITIYGSHNIIIKVKDFRSEVRTTQRIFYAIDM